MEVPLYGDNKVGQAALPSARLQAEAPLEAFGGGAAVTPITHAAQGLASEAMDVANKARDKAIDTMTQDGYAKLVQKKNELLHDPKNGALMQHGKDAFAAPETYGNEFDAAADKIQKDMPDPAARSLFQRMRQRERNELDAHINQHIGQQTEVFRKETYHGLISALSDDAVANFSPQKVADNLKTMKAATDQYAADEGLSGDDPAVKATREAQWKAITDKVHVGVVNRLVAQENYDQAREYFKANEGEIAGLSKDDLEAKIKKTDVLAQKDRYLTVASQLDENKGEVDAKSVPGYESLTGAQREALQRRFDYQQSPTAHHEFYSLSQGQVADLDKAEFETKYWSRFDQPHRLKAEAYWQAAVDAQRSGKDDAFKSMRGDRDMVVSALRKAKIVNASGELKGRDFETSQRFEDYVDDQFKTFQHENKRNPKDEEKQKIIQKAMLDKVFVDRTLLPDPEKPIGVLSEDELKNAYVPIDTIPRASRLKLVNIARSNGAIKGPEAGGPADDRAIVLLKSRIEKAYAAAKTGKIGPDKLVAIMKGE